MIEKIMVVHGALPLQPDRKCVVVLGMHRSGTSAVAGTLGLLGATLPQDLLAANPTNPRGHFESDSVLLVNEQMLQATGSAWYDFRGIACANLEPAIAAEFRARLSDALRGSFGDATLFVLKDPRFCRFFPLVLSVIEQFGASPNVIFCFRNPLEVAHSLRVRDGISLPHGLSLWLRHVLDAELHSRGLRRVFVNFSDFLRDWRQTVEQIEQQLGIVFSGERRTSEIDNFLDQGLRHNLANLDELRGWSEQGWLYHCYQALSELVSDPNGVESMRRLDVIHTSFDQFASFFSAGFHDYYSEILKLKPELEKLSEEAQSQRAQLIEVRSFCDEQNRHLQEANKQSLQLIEVNATLMDRIEKSKTQFEALKRSRSWRYTAPFRGAARSLRHLAKPKLPGRE